MKHVKKRSDKTKEMTGRLYLFPMVIAAGIIPLISRVYLYTNDELIRYVWFSDMNYRVVDVFLAYKSFALQCLLAAMLIIMAYGVFIRRRRFRRKKVFLLLPVYALFVIISGLASVSPRLAFAGSYERFEPVGVILAYLAIFIYSYNYIQSEDDVRQLFILMSIPVAVMLITGILQGAGSDPFNSGAVKSLITPAVLRESIGGISVRRNEGTSYLTLYNENYAGVYLAAVIPVLAAVIPAAKRKSVMLSAVLFTAGGFYVLYHSNSSSGWFALLISTGFTVFILLFGRRRAVVLSCAAAAALLAVSVLAMRVITVNSVQQESDYDTGNRNERVRKVVNIETGDDEVVFTLFDGNELHCSFVFDEEGNVRPDFTDRDGNTLIYYENEGACILDERFEYADAAVAGRYVQAVDANVAVFVIDERQWPMLKGEDGSYYYLNPDMKPVKYPHINKADIFPDGWMSGRGDIWNKSIPLIGHYPVFGCGSNLFITAYPQDDYIDKTYRLGRSNFEYDVKAHSFYLCNIIENGLIPGLCLMAFFAYYVIKGARLYSGIGIARLRNSFAAAAGAGLYSGCLAYMISAAANDSNVCTSPVFWTLLGTSMAVNEFLEG